MAHWTDGPEYAPLARPDVFVEPDAPPLASPDAARPPAPGSTAPSEPRPPEFRPGDAPPLARLVAPPPATRDPREPFDVASTPLTTWSTPAAGPGTAAPPPDAPPPNGLPLDLPPPPPSPSTSAWGAVHASNSPRPAAAWSPDQPYPPAYPLPVSHLPPPPHTWPPPAVNPSGFPPPAPPPWQVEQPWQPGQPPPRAGGFRPVTLTDILRATTPGVLICLAIGVIVPPLAIPLLLVGSALASRIRQRRPVVARAFSIATTAAFGLGLLVMVLAQTTFDVFTWYEDTVGWAQLANLVMLIGTPAIVGDSLRRGEPPEDTP